MTYGILTTSTGAWVDNCEFGTRAEAEAHLRAQFHREWIEKHEVAERSGTMGEKKKCWYRLREDGQKIVRHDGYELHDMADIAAELQVLRQSWEDEVSEAHLSRVAAMEEFIDKVFDYWSFDNDQRHTHTWHTREDLRAEYAKLAASAVKEPA